jgi:hypothetical protein
MDVGGLRFKKSAALACIVFIIGAYILEILYPKKGVTYDTIIFGVVVIGIFLFFYFDARAELKKQGDRLVNRSVLRRRHNKYGVYVWGAAAVYYALYVIGGFFITTDRYYIYGGLGWLALVLVAAAYNGLDNLHFRRSLSHHRQQPTKARPIQRPDNDPLGIR